MASPEKWSTISDHSTVLTTELNALANGSWSSESAAYDNSGGDIWAVAELAVTYGTNPTDLGAVDLYVNPDLGHGHDTAGSRGNPEYAKASFAVHPNTSAQLLKTAPFTLPPGQIKFRVYNDSGFAFPATGTTIRLYTFNKQVG